MSKKPPFTDEEDQQFFQTAMQGVKKLTVTSRAPLLMPKTLKKHSITHQKPENTPSVFYIESDFVQKDDWLGPEDSVEFLRNDLPWRLLQKLKRGQIAIEARLDLHHYTAHAAIVRTNEFIDEVRAQKKRWVLIIHGKGHLGRQKPILKNVISTHLRGKKEVLAMQSAQAKHGGTGAIYVLLKQGLIV